MHSECVIGFTETCRALLLRVRELGRRHPPLLDTMCLLEHNIK